MLRLRPGDIVAASLVAVAVAADLVLIAHQHETISTCVRTRTVAKIATLLLASHLVATIPHDPITMIGRRLRP